MNVSVLIIVLLLLSTEFAQPRDRLVSATPHGSSSSSASSGAGESVQVLRSVEWIEEMGRRSQASSAEMFGSKKSSCWSRAWAEIPDICARLDTNGRKLLGLKLAACHLSDAGMDNALQCDSLDVDRCVEQAASEPLVFQIYTEYFLNGVSLCYLMESERIKAHLSEGMSDLVSSAGLTASMLADFEERLQSTRGGMDGMHQFFGKFYKSFTWLKSQVEEVEAILRAVSENVGFVKTVMFYAAVLVLALIASASERTQDCRFLLIMCVLAAMAFEWASTLFARLPLAQQQSIITSISDYWGWTRPLFTTINLSSSSSSSMSSFEGDLDAAHLSWIVRLVLVAASTLVITITALLWQNLPVMNNSLIQRLVNEAKVSRAMLYRQQPIPPYHRAVWQQD